MNISSFLLYSNEWWKPGCRALDFLDDPLVSHLGKLVIDFGFHAVGKLVRSLGDWLNGGVDVQGYLYILDVSHALKHVLLFV